MNLFDDLDSVGRRALLRAHLHQLAVFLLRLNQQCTFGGVVAAWLLYVNMLTRLQTGDGHRSMPVVGAGNADGIHVFLLQDLAEVLLLCGRVTHRLLGLGGELIHCLGVHIAHVRDAGAILISLQRRQVGVPAAVDPDHRKIQAIVGAENLSVALSVGPDSQPGRSYRKRVEKLTTINHISPFVSIPQRAGICVCNTIPAI
jgi:hypothetical protein